MNMIWLNLLCHSIFHSVTIASRFNAPTFTYVCGVCVSSPPHSPTPRLLPLSSSHPHPHPQPNPHWRWRLLQYVPTNYVYSRLQASDMHSEDEPRTWNRELGMGSLLKRWRWSSGSSHRGVPRHQRHRHQSHRQRLAFWLFGWVTVPTSFPLRLLWARDTVRLGNGIGFGGTRAFGFVALSTLIC